MMRQSNPKLRQWILRITLLLAFALAVAALCWSRWVYVQIKHYAVLDQATQVAQAAGALPADAIVVFGAAEYDGRVDRAATARGLPVRAGTAISSAGSGWHLRG